jgi:hypothetical protein
MKARPTGEKRRKERARQEKKRDKAEKREQRKAERENRASRSDLNEDPDIAGIVPGPQPIPDELGVGEEGD